MAAPKVLDAITGITVFVGPPDRVVTNALVTGRKTTRRDEGLLIVLFINVAAYIAALYDKRQIEANVSDPGGK